MLKEYKMEVQMYADSDSDRKCETRGPHPLVSLCSTCLRSDTTSVDGGQSARPSVIWESLTYAEKAVFLATAATTMNKGQQRLQMPLLPFVGAQGCRRKRDGGWGMPGCRDMGRLVRIAIFGCINVARAAHWAAKSGAGLFLDSSAKGRELQMQLRAWAARPNGPSGLSATLGRLKF